MRTLSTWASGVALIAAAATGVVAACYNDVPGPAAPLPPTREVSPQGPRPGPIVPAPVVMADGGITPTTSPAVEPTGSTSPVVEPTGSRVVEMNQRFAPQSEVPPAPTPTQEVRDAGAADVVDLPPVPDASPEVPLDASAVKTR